MNSQQLYDSLVSKVDVRRGAPMGRANKGERPVNETIYDRYVPLNEGYEKGGAYWGLGEPLRVAYNKDLTFIKWYRSYNAVHKQGATYQRKTKTEYILYADYGQGWEIETIEATYRDITRVIKEYRVNAPQYQYKWKTRRVKI